MKKCPLHLQIPLFRSKLVLGALFFGVILSSFAKSSGPESSENTQTIEATAYPVKVLSRSSSRRFYLFDDPLSKSPFVGHLILLRNSNHEPVMALRVLKTYPDRKAFAAKYLKSYGKIESLETGQSLTAVEKVMDIPLNPIASAEITELREIEEEKSQLVQPLTSTAPPPSETPPNLNKAPLKPGEDPPPPPPPGTDPGEATGVAASAKKSAPNQDHQAPPPGEEDDDEDQIDADGVTIPERPKYDRYSYWLSGGLGVVRSPNPAELTQSVYMSAGNLRFGVTLSNPVFFRNSSLQDSFVLESGFFGYKVVAQTNDTYTLLGALLTLRYNLTLGERFGVFFYGGFGRGLVITASNPVLATYNALNTFIPSIGAGLLFQIGPAWYTRVDVGYEALTINLLLRL